MLGFKDWVVLKSRKMPNVGADPTRVGAKSGSLSVMEAAIFNTLTYYCREGAVKFWTITIVPAINYF